MNRFYSLFLFSFLFGFLSLMAQGTDETEAFRESFRDGAYNDPNMDANITKFCNMVDEASDDKETFIFMTDPHLMGSGSSFTTANEITFKHYIGTLYNYYEKAPLDIIISGGDWLNQKDTYDAACNKLKYVDNSMRKLFSPYLPVMGNHDTNYIGTTVNGKRSLEPETACEILFHEEGASHYSYMGLNTVFYVLDNWTATTAGGVPPGHDKYFLEQADWLAMNLLENDNLHAVIVMHAYYRTNVDVGEVHYLAARVAAIVAAYNRRGTVTNNSHTYNFSNCKGVVHCIIAGHAHEDAITTSTSVPVLLTTDFKMNNLPTFDLCLLDYGNGTLRTVRAGAGNDRILPLAMDANQFESLTVSSAGCRTFCSESALDFSNVPGLQAYIVTGVTDEAVPQLALTPANVVPANTGVLIMAAQGKYNVPKIASCDLELSENKLIGVNTNTDLVAPIYVLMNDNDAVGFLKTSQTFTVGAHTAYLDTSVFDNIVSADEAVKTISVDEMTPTGISYLNKNERTEDNTTIYNLSGIRISVLGKGVKIINGKKILLP